MLNFFRRFQKGIFVAITIMIVVSFSFFGTNGAADRQIRDEEVFTAIDGQSVKRSEIEALAAFLSTDAKDQLNWGVPLGANFLNDGVIRNDFLKLGLGRLLFEEYYPDLKEEWEGKWKRERTFQTYRHPDASYFSADAIWSHFAPQLKESLKAYKASSIENAGAHFEKKANLYLAEGDFSENMLRQVLYFQMQQAKWIKPDRNLQQQNLALFGYRNLNDWFGHDFTRLVASFILNASKVALKQGYKVSYEEALFDLKNRAMKAFESQKQNPLMTFTDPNAYLREQLRYLGMDLGQAAESWQKVLLFRKLFNDLGSAVVVDRETFLPFVDYVSKQVEVVAYQLPKEMQIRDFRQMQRFETYLKLAAKESNGLIPTKWQREDEVIPELLMKRYLVSIKEADHKNLSQKISLKALWDWQVSDAGWKKLSDQFTALSLAAAESPEERFAALDQLDESTKELVDQKTRIHMTEEHPDWIEEALAMAPAEKKTLVFYKKAIKPPLKGMKDSEKAVAMLDLNELNSENPPVVTLRDVGDKTWQMTLYDRSPNWEVATFAEVERDGILEELTLEYLKKQGGKEEPAKPFNEVRDQLAQDIFRREINQIKRSIPDQSAQSIDQIATYRTYAYLKSMKEDLSNGRAKEEEMVLSEFRPQQDQLPARTKVEEQFKLVKTESIWDRSQNRPGHFSSILAVEPNKFSDLIDLGKGEHFFFKMIGSKSQDQQELLTDLMEKSRDHISNELQITLAEKLIREFKDKEAIKLITFKGEKGSRAV